LLAVSELSRSMRGHRPPTRTGTTCLGGRTGGVGGQVQGGRAAPSIDRVVGDVPPPPPDRTSWKVTWDEPGCCRAVYAAVDPCRAGQGRQRRHRSDRRPAFQGVARVRILPAASVAPADAGECGDTPSSSGSSWPRSGYVCRRDAVHERQALPRIKPHPSTMRSAMTASDGTELLQSRLSDPQLPSSNRSWKCGCSFGVYARGTHGRLNHATTTGHLRAARRWLACRESPRSRWPQPAPRRRGGRC
jgi:hypothetical protein